MFDLNDVVCFRETHKWVGCLGFVNEIKNVKDMQGNDTLRLMIGVPCPQKGVAYIFCSPEDVENMNAKYPYEIKSEEDEE